LKRLSLTICVCTYRRPAGLAALLEGLVGQRFTDQPAPALGVVIADNEGCEEVSALCERFARDSGLPIRYVREPQRGISHARNACLAAIPADCDFFLMIDDDEVPHPDWIDRLLLAQRRTGADVVEGQIVPVFPEGTPDWIVQGDYFGWHPDLNDPPGPGQQDYPELDEARTNNVLVRSAVVRTLGLRFDPRFALSGGGDIVFFRTIRAAGYRIVYARDAGVREMIPPHRANLRFLWRRWYRVGANQRFKRPVAREPDAGLRRIVKRNWRTSGGSEIATGVAMLVASLVKGRPAIGRLAPGLRRFAHGLGQVSSAIGIRYEQYRHGGGGESLHGDPREEVAR
jgi:succinoglycan biosynthesis protein ExoM